MKKTLIIVDVQNDFLKGGALAVDTADENFVKEVDAIRDKFDQVIFTADAHPENHISFSDFPPHCVKGTFGGEVALTIKEGDILIEKGKDAEVEEFSPFVGGRDVDKVEGDEVYVLGLAGDYCVKASLEDLLNYRPEKKYFAIKDLIYSVDKSKYGPVDHFDGKVTFINSNEI